ncbi:MAG TPA: S41 family peptidase [Candidatus Limnocylindria bacterium]
MSDERIIQYLRQRGRVLPPHDLVADVMAAIDRPAVAPSRFGAYVPAFVALGAAAVIAVLALVLGPARVGPAPTTSAGPSAAASEATVDELRAAVTAAVDVLRSQAGVDGTGTYEVRDELGSVSWFSWRPNGDQVVVNLRDVDVTESGWWLDPDGGPPNRGTNISTTIQALVGGSYYFTRGDVGGDDLWISGLREGSPDVLGTPFPAALDGRVDPWMGEFALTLEGEASVRPIGDGGDLWTLVRPVREGSLVQEFDIGPDGALRSMVHELVGVAPTVDERPITSAVIELTILDHPEPIPAPDTDSRPDPAAFGMPDLELAPGVPEAEIEYRRYVEDALAYMQAYHWNSAEIDWAAARSAALDGLPADPDPAQAHQRIQNAIQTFDFSTVFVRPQDVPPDDGGPGSGPTALPTAVRIGDVGHIVVPTPPSSGASALREYLRAARLGMGSVEEASPACGWIVDLRDHAGGAWGPPMAVLGGLVGEGRALTFVSGSAEWWLEVGSEGLVTSAGFDESDVLVDSPYIVTSIGGDEEIVDAFAAEPPHLPRVPGAPVAVLVGNGTVTGGEQTLVAFLGRPSTRVFGGPTGGSPMVAPNTRMADEAVLRMPTGVPVDRDGTRYTTSILPDEILGDTRPIGGDVILEAAVDWLGGSADCP